MMDKDVILAKTAIIQRCLQRIQKTTALDPASLDDVDKQDIFVLNLQRAIQAAIDMATHIISVYGWGLPESLKGNFLILRQNSVIPQNLCNRMQKMVGFRNIAFHDYQAMDLNVLKTVLTDHLRDLDDLYRAVLAFCELNINNENGREGGNSDEIR